MNACLKRWRFRAERYSRHRTPAISTARTHSSAEMLIQIAHLHEACCDLVADVARISGKVQVRVAGTSMVPTLWPGDVVVVRRCEPSELLPNSVVMFRRSGGLVVHRLILRTADQVTARGDAHSCLDEPVTLSDVIGRVELVIRNGRSIDPKGSIWCSGVAFVLRHSEWCACLFLRLSFRMRRTRVAEAA
jgi:signal peptidase I